MRRAVRAEHLVSPAGHGAVNGDPSAAAQVELSSDILCEGARRGWAHQEASAAAACVVDHRALAREVDGCPIPTGRDMWGAARALHAHRLAGCGAIHVDDPAARGLIGGSNVLSEGAGGMVPGG